VPSYADGQALGVACARGASRLHHVAYYADGQELGVVCAMGAPRLHLVSSYAEGEVVLRRGP
jgi:hypothetical protein